MPRQRNWTRDELILALSVYFQLPFGRLNHGTKEVQELGRLIGRTKNSAALRLVNFAACDPYILATGRHGMSGGERVCQPIWDEFADDKERLFLEAERIKAQLLSQPIEQTLNIQPADLVGEDREAVVRQRVNQSAFRTMILYNYEGRCAITGINVPELLVASHIVPWVESTPEQKLNPENGICLSAMYDKALDKGLITISPDDYTISLSSALMEYESESYYDKHFRAISGQKLTMPIEHLPSRDFLAWHRENVFVGK